MVKRFAPLTFLLSLLLGFSSVGHAYKVDIQLVQPATEPTVFGRPNLRKSVPIWAIELLSI